MQLNNKLSIFYFFCMVCFYLISGETVNTTIFCVKVDYVAYSLICHFLIIIPKYYCEFFLIFLIVNINKGIVFVFVLFYESISREHFATQEPHA